jgi:hypothetical protein
MTAIGGRIGESAQTVTAAWCKAKALRTARLQHLRSEINRRVNSVDHLRHKLTEGAAPIVG